MPGLIKYLVFALLYVLLLVFGYSGGPIESLIQIVPGVGPAEKSLIAAVALGVIGGFLIHLLIILQSFVFNIYHVVMTTVRWEAENEGGDS